MMYMISAILLQQTQTLLTQQAMLIGMARARREAAARKLLSCSYCGTRVYADRCHNCGAPKGQ